MRIIYQYLFKISKKVVNFMKYSYDMNLFNLNVTCNKYSYLNVRAGEEWRTDSYSFTQNKFYYITEGHCTITIDGKEITGKKNDWFFIPAGKEYHYVIDNSKDDFQKHWMHFDIYPNNDLFARLNLPYVIKSIGDTTVINLFEKYKSVKLSFHTAVENPTVTYSMPYGFIEKTANGEEEQVFKIIDSESCQLVI